MELQGAYNSAARVEIEPPERRSAEDKDGDATSAGAEETAGAAAAQATRAEAVLAPVGSESGDCSDDEHAPIAAPAARPEPPAGVPSRQNTRQSESDGSSDDGKHAPIAAAARAAGAEDTASTAVAAKTRTSGVS